VARHDVGRGRRIDDDVLVGHVGLAFAVADLGADDRRLALLAVPVEADPDVAALAAVEVVVGVADLVGAGRRRKRDHQRSAQMRDSHRLPPFRLTTRCATPRPRHRAWVQADLGRRGERDRKRAGRRAQARLAGD
jgi:hypothetical protein